MSSTNALRLLSLYPREMNIYGDRGNVLALTHRGAAHKLDLEVVELHPGDPFPENIDIVIGGGGQDSGQRTVARDLQRHRAALHDLAANGTPMLLVCGLYQLFGHRFITHDSETLEGIGVLDVETRGESERMIGNTIVESDAFGEIIGYENHSGNTVLGPGSAPLGRVIQGAGNNPNDRTEGARSHRVIGTYLHGSLLPKNPAISDFLIGTAANNRFGEFTPSAEVSSTVLQARQSAKARPR